MGGERRWWGGGGLILCDLHCIIFFVCLFVFFAENTRHGPVFTQEPSDSIFPMSTDDKQVFINCKAKGNPPPHYRWVVWQLFVYAARVSVWDQIYKAHIYILMESFVTSGAIHNLVMGETHSWPASQFVDGASVSAFVETL